MGKGMVAYFMPVGDNPSNDIGVRLAIFTYDEEGGFYILLLQNIQDPGSPNRIRPVVKCENDLSRLVASSLNHV